MSFVLRCRTSTIKHSPSCSISVLKVPSILEMVNRTLQKHQSIGNPVLPSGVQLLARPEMRVAIMVLEAFRVAAINLVQVMVLLMVECRGKAAAVSLKATEATLMVPMSSQWLVVVSSLAMAVAARSKRVASLANPLASMLPDQIQAALEWNSLLAAPLVEAMMHRILEDLHLVLPSDLPSASVLPNRTLASLEFLLLASRPVRWAKAMANLAKLEMPLAAIRHLG
jgi:hypothetical protein